MWGGWKPVGKLESVRPPCSLAPTHFAPPKMWHAEPCSCGRCSLLMHARRHLKYWAKARSSRQARTAVAAAELLVPRAALWLAGPSRACCPHDSTRQPSRQVLLPQGWGGDLHAHGRQGLTCQMSSAYSRMVRSEENLPLPAVYMMDLRVHSAWSLYTSSTSSWARR